jgi:hypothetical protein
MRLVKLCAIAWIAVVPPAFGEVITILLDFQGPHSEESIAEMKREFSDVMKDTGIPFDFSLLSEAAHHTFSDLLVVRFKGKCVLEPAAYLYDERGPMAFTYSTGGVVQPFSEVECGKLTSVVRGAMSGGDFAHADLLFGRALGRVLAHEVVHMLAKSAAHGHDGVAKKALSGAQLIAPQLNLADDDVQRLHHP